MKYENRGYKTIKHEKCLVEDGFVLVYEIMEKHISFKYKVVVHI